MSDKNDAEKLLNNQGLRLMYEAFVQAGINPSLTKEDVIRRFEALERGLPAEDEFAVLAGWLGKCSLIHKLDQIQFPPHSKELYQVPDFLAIFEDGNRTIPTLVEVKKTKDISFKWTKRYYGKLRAYADLLNLPLLIACKFRPGDGDLVYWTLFDASIFDSPDSSYKVTLEKASHASLLGKLAGDFMLEVKAGVGLHIRMDLIGDKDDWKSMKEENRFYGQTSLFWTNGGGKEMDAAQLSPGLLALLLLIPQYWSDSSLYDGDSHRIYSFVLQDNHPIFAHQMLGLLLTEAQARADDNVRWRKILSQGELPISSKDIYEAAHEASNKDIFEQIFHPIPGTTPTFLQQSHAAK